MALASEPKKKVMKEKNYQKGDPKSDLAPGLKLSLPGPAYKHTCGFVKKLIRSQALHK